MKPCPICGAIIDNGDSMCPECRVVMAQNTPTAPVPASASSAPPSVTAPDTCQFCGSKLLLHNMRRCPACHRSLSGEPDVAYGAVQGDPRTALSIGGTMVALILLLFFIFRMATGTLGGPKVPSFKLPALKTSAVSGTAPAAAPGKCHTARATICTLVCTRTPGLGCPRVYATRRIGAGTAQTKHWS